MKKIFIIFIILFSLFSTSCRQEPKFRIEENLITGEYRFFVRTRDPILLFHNWIPDKTTYSSLEEVRERIEEIKQEELIRNRWRKVEEIS